MTRTQCQKNRFFNFQRRLLKKILIILKGLNPSKAAGIDNLSGKFLKNGARVLAPPIYNITNFLLTTTPFQAIAKLCKLRHFLKKAPRNYRPISLFPLLSKVIERFVHDQIQEFFIKGTLMQI